MTTICPHCQSTDTTYKSKAGKWECNACEERFEAAAPGTAAAHASLEGKAARPKTIFFSYGHDGNKELVDQFKADLEKRGHTVWIDYERIGTWDDWKGQITRGIHESQMAIAFLSIHSVRDPGVCRNEIAIALHHFGTVYPFLLEKVPAENIPVSISSLQWPDLSDWRDIREGRVPGQDFARFYEEKLVEIVSRIEGEATRFHDETAVLRRVLEPSAFDGRFAQHLDGFVGREWVFEAYEEWLEHRPESRVFWVKAGPGFGKTALAVNLAHRYRGAIVGTWFCDSQSIELKDPARALRTLAFQLALRWDDYRARLLPRLGLFAGSGEPQIREALETLAKKNLSDLFSHIISEPLAGLIWREKKLVILMDALDEATDAGANPIAELISTRFLELPPWIGFVVTSRPDPEVVGHLQRFKPFEIAAEDNRNTQDLECYCHQAIGGSKSLAHLDEAERARLCDVLVQKSEGMILYLRLIEEGLREGSLAVNQLETQEAGLPGLYSRYHQVFTRRFAGDYEEKIQPFLRLMLAAPGALPLDLAAEALGWSKEQIRKTRARIGSFLVESQDGLRFVHKTLAEWLASEPSGVFFTDAQPARNVLESKLWQKFLTNGFGQSRESEIKIWEIEWMVKLRPFVWQTLNEKNSNDSASCINPLKSQDADKWVEAYVKSINQDSFICDYKGKFGPNIYGWNNRLIACQALNRLIACQALDCIRPNDISNIAVELEQMLDLCNKVQNHKDWSKTDDLIAVSAAKKILIHSRSARPHMRLMNFTPHQVRSVLETAIHGYSKNTLPESMSTAWSYFIAISTEKLPNPHVQCDSRMSTAVCTRLVKMAQENQIRPEELREVFKNQLGWIPGRERKVSEKINFIRSWFPCCYGKWHLHFAVNKFVSEVYNCINANCELYPNMRNGSHREWTIREVETVIKRDYFLTSNAIFDADEVDFT